MHPTIRHGERITVQPVEPSSIKRGDIVFYRSQGGVIAHRVMAINKKAGSDAPVFALRGDASRTFDEPVNPERLLGKIVSVERRGRRIDPHGTAATLFYKAYSYGSCIKQKVLRVFQSVSRSFTGVGLG
jgi:hypothetical protein